MRKQRRQKAILPLKVTVENGGVVHLAHTLDISASGARLVVTSQFKPGTHVFVEFKRRRVTATVVWNKPLKNSNYDFELGVQMRDAGSAFWGVSLPLREADHAHEANVKISEVEHLLSKQA